MMRLSPIAFWLLVAQAAAYDGHQMNHAHPPMSPMVAQAMRSVEESCHWDVSTLCAVPGDHIRDPILDWVMNPSAPSPLMGQDMSVMLNRMMDSAARLADEQPIYVLISIEEAQPEKTASEQVFDSMVSKLADQVASSSSDEAEGATAEEGDVVNAPPSFDAMGFSKLLVEHGKEVLEGSEGDEERRRLARRLTEVHPDMFEGPHNKPRLPFGCLKNRCLMSAFEQGAVSPGCADALRRVERVSQVEATHHLMVVERERETFLGLAVLYGLLCIGTLFLIHRRVTKYGRSMRGNNRLKRRILQAVYNNPAIKAAIAADLNEELGYIPPLPPHVLARMNGKDPRKNWKIMRLIKMLVLTGVLVLAFVNPLLAMPVMCIMVGIRFFQLACCPAKIPKQSCSCCCCGVSTDDVASGNVTSAQACCTCCNGTGVCAPNCADCCGTASDSCGCGCSCCCCCGVSPDDVAAGNVTSAQSCCSCCNGTGKCCGADGCCCCCSSGSSSPGRPVRRSKEQVYMGIPVQVV